MAQYQFLKIRERLREADWLLQDRPGCAARRILRLLPRSGKRHRPSRKNAGGHPCGCSPSPRKSLTARTAAQDAAGTHLETADLVEALEALPSLSQSSKKWPKKRWPTEQKNWSKKLAHEPCHRVSRHVIACQNDGRPKARPRNARTLAGQRF